MEGNDLCPSVSSCYEELRKTKKNFREYGRGDGSTGVKIGKGCNLMAYWWTVVVVVVVVG